jgi:anti-sigma regulatory factor (Ser/Thr protein kinase)
MTSDRADPVRDPKATADDRRPEEIERLRAAVRRQAVVIATLSEAVSNCHRGLGALRAENAELRAESRKIRDRLETQASGGSRADDDLVELVVEPGPRAPSVARQAITGALGDRVAEPVLANAQLVMSELVTNSVRHSGAPDRDDLVVRVRVWDDHCRLEVEDSGHEGVIAPQPPDLGSGGGMGLNLVETVSERWGLVRAADGPTRVWAQLACGAAPEVASRPALRVV